MLLEKELHTKFYVQPQKWKNWTPRFYSSYRHLQCSINAALLFCKAWTSLAGAAAGVEATILILLNKF